MLGLEGVDLTRSQAWTELEFVPLLAEGLASVEGVGDACQLASQPRDAGVRTGSSLVTRNLPHGERPHPAR